MFTCDNLTEKDAAISGLPLWSHPRNVSNREVEANAEAVVKR